MTIMGQHAVSYINLTFNYESCTSFFNFFEIFLVYLSQMTTHAGNEISSAPESSTLKKYALLDFFFPLENAMLFAFGLPHIKPVYKNKANFGGGGSSSKEPGKDSI